jgi:hypothetical protein
MIRTRCHKQMDESEIYKILHPVELHSKNGAGSVASNATSRSGGGHVIFRDSVTQ